MISTAHDITGEIDLERLRLAPDCHPWVSSSPLAVREDGTAGYRCPLCGMGYRASWSLRQMGREA